MRGRFLSNDLGGPDFLEDFGRPDAVAFAFSNRRLIHTRYIDDAET